MRDATSDFNDFNRYAAVVYNVLCVSRGEKKSPSTSSISSVQGSQLALYRLGFPHH